MKFNLNEHGSFWIQKNVWRIWITLHGVSNTYHHDLFLEIYFGAPRWHKCYYGYRKIFVLKRKT